MKKLICILLSVLLCLLCGCAESSVNSSDILGDSTEKSESLPKPAFSDMENVIDKVQKGINVEGALLWSNATELPDHWIYKESTYKGIKEKGFDHIRIPCNFGDNTVKDDPEHTITPEYFECLDKAVNYALSAGLIAVIDFHGGKPDLNKDFVNAKPIFINYWEQVAKRYKNYPNTLMFELINEPTFDFNSLNELQMETVAKIRETNPTRVIALAATPYNGDYGMWNTEFPKDDPNVMISIHSYDPMGFTHQGADWSEPVDNTVVNFREDDKPAVLSDIENCEYYAQRTGRKVWISEWGTYLRIAPKDDVTEYVKYFTEKCKEKGISYCYWEYGNGFGAFNVGDGTWKDFVADYLVD